MTISLETFRVQVDYQIDADDEMLSENAREELIKAALTEYSKDCPDIYSEDVTGDGGRYYAISALTNWSEGFSNVTRIEYPAAAIASDETPTYLDPDDWVDDFWAEVGGTLTRHIYLKSAAPAATETMRVTYSMPYTFSSSPSAAGPAQQDFFAICNLAACLCCRALATKFASLGNTLLNVDSSAHTTKASEYASRAEEYCTMYKSHMGLLEGIAPASEFVDLDTAPGWPAGRQYIFHGGGTR